MRINRVVLVLMLSDLKKSLFKWAESKNVGRSFLGTRKIIAKDIL